jgi:hypothetical protein
MVARDLKGTERRHAGMQVSREAGMTRATC